MTLSTATIVSNRTLPLAVLAAGGAACVLILLVVVARRMARRAGDRRRSRADRAARPMLLEAMAEGRLTAELSGARGALRRAQSRLAVEYLPKTRGEAHDLLEQLLGDRGVTDRAIRRASRGGRRRRARAAELLGAIGSAPAAACLERVLAKDRSRPVRVVAVRALAKTGSASAAVAIIGSLDRKRPVPEGVVASALLEVGAQAIPPLRDVLGTQSRTVKSQRAIAAEALGLLEAMPAWPDLAQHAVEDHLEVRICAVRALGQLGVPDAGDAVVECLQSGEPTALRAAAARALGRIGDRRHTPALVACVHDSDYAVAHNAAEALTALGDDGRRALGLISAEPGLCSVHAREALAYARLQPLRRFAWAATSDPAAGRSDDPVPLSATSTA